MRNPARIDPVLDYLRTLWKQHPDLRLGQLLVNAFNRDRELYYVEDDVLLTALAVAYVPQGDRT